MPVSYTHLDVYKRQALYHTGAVLLPLEYSAKAGEYACPAYPDHELFRLFLLQSAPCEFFYRDDAMAKVEELFGEDFLPASQEVLNPFPFTYYTKEEVFAKSIEEPSDTSFFPVILSWRESGKRICVTALMGETQGAGCPITVGGIVCTAENIESLKAQNPLHSFTFEQQADGRLVLKGYQVVSFVPKMCIRDRTFIPLISSVPTIAAPDAVAVHWAVGGRCPPYSNGKRNCRSAEQK